MERKQRAKMPPSQRAKQFMPFAAVKGLEEAIAKEEKALKRTERPEYSEDRVSTVNTSICKLRKGNRICIRFYSCSQCLEAKGQVNWIDWATREMIIDGIHIAFDDILDISDLTE